jgi:hypothetical protein
MAMLPHFGFPNPGVDYNNMNEFEFEILETTKELADTVNKTRIKVVDIKTKLISSGGKTSWKDGVEYIFNIDDIEISVSDITHYVEPRDYSEIMKNNDVKIKVNGISKIQLLPLLKNKLRQAKIEYVLQ